MKTLSKQQKKEVIKGLAKEFLEYHRLGIDATRAKVVLPCMLHLLFQTGQHCYLVMLVAATNPLTSGGSGCVLTVLASRRYTQPIL